MAPTKKHKVTYAPGDSGSAYNVMAGLDFLGIVERKTNAVGRKWWQIRAVTGFKPEEYSTRKAAVEALLRFLAKTQWAA